MSGTKVNNPYKKKKGKESDEQDQKVKTTVYWFRNALRLHDNPSFYEACKTSSSIVPIYIIDKETPFAQSNERCVNSIRAQFVLECLSNLNGKLIKLNNNQKLYVFVGKADEIIPEVIVRVNADRLSYEKDIAVPIRERDVSVLQAVKDRLREGGDIQQIEFDSMDTHTLFPMEKYLSRCPGGVAPSSYGSFVKIFSGKMGDVPKEVPEITDIPPSPDKVSMFNSSQILSCSNNNAKEKFLIPTLKDLGYKEKSLSISIKSRKAFSDECPAKGGEDEALIILDQCMKRKSWIAKFEKPKTEPNALQKATTGLSPYIKHGCLSPRRFYHQLTAVYKQFDSYSKPPVSLHGQMIWREYNYLHSYTTPHFDRMVSNPKARQIPWDNDDELLNKWRNSQTGYPFIDAIMTQLRTTGWIHHLARHSAACFLTRGDLWQSWEKGAAVFEEYLIDADWSINNFNWQWLSCTAHFYQYFRCYSPVAFGQKTDKNGDYIRKWLPQFKKFPAKFIYEPWKAPLTVQKECGVIIGKDYPHPIVDHKIISKENMAKMKLAYAQQAAKGAAENATKANESTASRNNSGNTSNKRRKKN